MFTGESLSVPAEGQRDSWRELHNCHSEAWGTSPTFKCVPLPLSDRCIKPVTYFVRISFVQAASALFLADVGDRGECEFKFPSAVLENEVEILLHHEHRVSPKEEKAKRALQPGRRANVYSSSMHPSIHPIMHPPVY